VSSAVAQLGSERKSALLSSPPSVPTAPASRAQVGAADATQLFTEPIASDRLMQIKKYPLPSPEPNAEHSLSPSPLFVIAVQSLAATHDVQRIRCAAAHSSTEP
jgi:hypothetical protein